MELFVDLLKIIVPAFIVFLAVYFVLKSFLRSQLQIQQIKSSQDGKKSSISIKLQAYERLALYCERMDIPNLLLRLSAGNMSNEDLKNALMITIQKEYEHNMVQQIYVSNNLWKIILLAKNSIQRLVISNYENLDPNGNADALARNLIARYNEQKINPITKALEAIRKETEFLLS